MTMILDLSTPEKFAAFEKAYLEALRKSREGEPFDLKAVVEKSGGIAEDTQVNLGSD